MAERTIIVAEGSDSTSIGGALLTVFADDGLTILTCAKTSTNGGYAWEAPDPGDYLVTMEKPKIRFPLSTPITVADTGGDTTPGAEQYFTIMGDVITTPTPAGIGMCIVNGYVHPVSPANVVCMWADIEGGQGFHDDSIPGVEYRPVISAGGHYETLVDAEGYWEFLLPKGARVTIQSPNMPYRKEFIVPNEESFHVADLSRILGFEDVEPDITHF